MDGRLTVPVDGLEPLVDLLMTNSESWARHWAGRTTLSIVNLLALLRHWNPRKKSRRNVAHHYDLSNALFDTFLDPWRQYSCAYFHDPDESLHSAQVNKLARLAAKLDLQAGDNILDIGCGWGGLGMAMAACGQNTKVTGITLSRHQLEYAAPALPPAALTIVSAIICAITATRLACFRKLSRSVCWNMLGLIIFQAISTR